MASVYWAPKSERTAQVVTVTVGGTLAGETFTISVGGVAIATHTDTDTVIATTRAALVTAWNNSTHPYATGITASNGAGGAVILTADSAGIPFAVTLNTPGGSATLGQATTQANTSEHDASVAANWSGGAVPGASDDVRIPAGTPAIYWGLDAISATLDDVEIEHGAGPIGIPVETFKTGDDSYNADYREYRTTYMTLKCTDLFIGRNKSLASVPPPGSSLIKVDTSTAANAKIWVFQSAPQTGPHPPILIKANHSGAVVNNYGGYVGVASEVLGDTTTVSAIYNYGTSAAVVTGLGVTVATVEAHAGRALLYSNPTSLLLVGEAADVTLFTAGTIPLKRGKGHAKIQGGQVAFTAME